MNYSDYKQRFLSGLAGAFPATPVELLEINFRGTIPVFFVKAENDEILAQLWDKLSIYIAANYQTILETEYATWNIYLFFLMPTAVPKALKYKIENDTFSSRKIIIEGDIALASVVSEHILNDNLKILTENKKKEEFKRDDIISSLLEGRVVWGEKEINRRSGCCHF